MEENVWGKSALINLNSCNDNIKNPEKIKEFVDKLCSVIKMKKFGPLHLERFGFGDLEGYSCMQFIETSTVVAHFDEKKHSTNRAFIDIFSCKDFNEKDAVKFCKDFFGTKKAKVKIYERK